MKGYNIMKGKILKESQCDKTRVERFLWAHPEIISAEEDYQNPGTLKILSGKSYAMKELKPEGVYNNTIGQIFFACGICMNYFHVKKYNCISHVTQCILKDHTQDARKTHRNKRRNEKQRNYYRQRKKEAACGGRPLKRRKISKTPTTTTTSSSTDRSANNTDVTIEDITISDEEEDTGPYEHIEQLDDVTDVANTTSSGTSTSSVLLESTLNSEPKLLGIWRTVRKSVATTANVLDGSNFLMELWQPSCCPKADGPSCDVVLRGDVLRLCMLDVTFPQPLRVRRLQCQVHNVTFSYIDDEVMRQIPTDANIIPDAIVKARTIMSRAFCDFIIGEFESCLCPSQICESIKKMWAIHLRKDLCDSAAHFHRVKEIGLTDETFDRVTDEELTAALVQLRDSKEELTRQLSPTLVTELITAWWHTEKEDEYNRMVLNVGKESTWASGDHTYWAVRGLGVCSSESPNKWVPIKASVFFVLNQNGDVVQVKICPSDEPEHVVSSLRSIWQSQVDSDERLQCYITDNVHKDKGVITEAYQQIFQDQSSILIGQDLFHAKERIAKTLRHQSKSYIAAKGELMDIMVAFRRTEEHGGYKSAVQAATRLKKWAEKYSTEVEDSSLSDIDKLMMVGQNLCQEVTSDEPDSDDEPAAEELDTTYTSTTTCTMDLTEDMVVAAANADLLKQASLHKGEVQHGCIFMQPDKIQLQCAISCAPETIFMTAELGKKVERKVNVINAPDKQEGFVAVITELIQSLPLNTVQEIRDSSTCCTPMTFTIQEDHRIVIQGHGTCKCKCQPCSHAIAAVLDWMQKGDEWVKLKGDEWQKGLALDLKDTTVGPVTEATVKVINNILQPDVIGGLLALQSMEDNRGTMLNENFHRFLKSRLGMSDAKCSMALVEVKLKQLHTEFNSTRKESSSVTRKLLNQAYSDALSVLNGTKTRLITLGPANNSKQPSLQDLIKQGFSLRKAKDWCQHEEDAVKAFIQQLYLGQKTIESRNPYHCISHHVLNKSKSEADVREYAERKYFRP